VLDDGNYRLIPFGYYYFSEAKQARLDFLSQTTLCTGIKEACADCEQFASETGFEGLRNKLKRIIISMLWKPENGPLLLEIAKKMVRVMNFRKEVWYSTVFNIMLVADETDRNDLFKPTLQEICDNECLRELTS
jgi:hypothetical protein